MKASVYESSECVALAAVVALSIAFLIKCEPGDASRAGQERAAGAATPDSLTAFYTEDFESPRDTPPGVLPSGWWFEGASDGSTARIAGGRLLVDATANPGIGCTVWLDRQLPEDVQISFDVHVLDAIDLANNMNLFVHFRDPDHKQLSHSRAERDDGSYPNYHGGRLEGTIVTHVALGTPDSARLRLRQVPPLDPILDEHRGYHAGAGHTYGVVITHTGSRVSYNVDGQTLLEAELPARKATSGGGYLGFRTWNTKLWWDNLQIRRVVGHERSGPVLDK